MRSYLVFLVTEWSLGKQLVLWHGIWSPIVGVQFRDIVFFFNIREHGEQVSGSYLTQVHLGL